jgi:hypothetical protein
MKMTASKAVHLPSYLNLKNAKSQYHVTHALVCQIFAISTPKSYNETMFEEIIHILRDIVLIVIMTTMNLLSSALDLVSNIEPPTERSAPSVVILETNLPTPESLPSEGAEETDSAESSVEHSPTPEPEGDEEELPMSEPIPEETVSLTEDSPSPVSISDVNALARDALVNIFCTTRTRSGISASSGSGIIIDARGVVLTDAHVAAPFLLESESARETTDCVIRTGAPAEKTYDASLLFISSTWIEEHADLINDNHALGTGESDVALLLIDTSLTDDPLPEVFPFIPLRSIDASVEEDLPILVAGYPAEFLSGSAITRDLWPVTALTQVLDIYTFGDNTLDLFSVEGNIAAQQGSSGGGMIALDDTTLAGIVVTSSEGDNTDERVLNAITPYHINHVFLADAGMSLSQYLSGNLAEEAHTFMNQIAPDLHDILLDAM